MGQRNISRIAGKDRYETSALVASRVLAGRSRAQVFIVRGDAFPDALSVSAVSSAIGAPVLLVRPGALPASVRAVLASGHVGSVTVVGGVAAVSPAVASAAEAAAGVTAERVAGPDRYATSAAFAAWALSRHLASNAFVGLATGANYPDAMAGGVVAGAHGGVLVLTPGPVLGSEAADLLRSACDTDTAVEVFGGVASVSEYAESQARFSLPER